MNSILLYKLSSLECEGHRDIPYGIITISLRSCRPSLIGERAPKLDVSFAELADSWNCPQPYPEKFKKFVQNDDGKKNIEAHTLAGDFNMYMYRTYMHGGTRPLAVKATFETQRNPLFMVTYANPQIKMYGVIDIGPHLLVTINRTNTLPSQLATTYFVFTLEDVVMLWPNLQSTINPLLQRKNSKIGLDISYEDARKSIPEYVQWEKLALAALQQGADLLKGKSVSFEFMDKIAR